MLGQEILAALQVEANRSAPGRSGTACRMTRPGNQTVGPRGTADERRRLSRYAPARGGEDADDYPTGPPTATSRLRGAAPARPPEREERRAAQARATAIEQARREAKRRACGAAVERAETLRRGAVRGLKVVIWSVLLIVVGCRPGPAALLHADHVGARHRRSPGSARSPRRRSSRRPRSSRGHRCCRSTPTRSPSGWPTIRRVASARVQREYPSTLRITVVERVPVVVKDYPDGPHLFDRDGVDFATAPPPPGAALYRRRTIPGPSDPADRGGAARC